jgi:2-keto-4-pentenoate hydratase/2-oxohepta-3-ene-1,7-dioic acid hydratase in catechol pathway
MRLATFIPPEGGAPCAGEVRDGHMYPYDPGVEVVELLAQPTPPRAGGERVPLAEVTLLAPVPRPRCIFGIGLNYSDHAAETGREPPAQPMVFMKTPASAAPPGAPVAVPAVVRRLDYEGELAVIMGAGGQVAGYAVADDVSARDLQGREPQWTRAKGADGFCPFGPWVTTADEVPDPHHLRLRTWVNDELRQDASTELLIFRIPELVAFLSETCTLEPGDVILTGTPSGVGMAMDPPRFLASGDVVRIEIESLGSIEHGIA